MAKTKSQRMREYRERTKALLGDEWLRRENQRVQNYFKTVSELTTEEQEKRRENNKVYSATYRKRQKQRQQNDVNDISQDMETTVSPTATNIDENGVSSTTNEDSIQFKVKMNFQSQQSTSTDRGRESRGRKRVSRALATQYRRNNTLKEENESLKRKLNSTRKKLGRLEKKLHHVPSTPRSKADALLTKDGVIPKEAPNVRKMILFAECMAAEINTAASSNDQQRQNVVRRVVTGKITKKYRMKAMLGHHTKINRRKLTTSSKTIELKKRSRMIALNMKIGRDIREFLSRDDNSRVLPGKSDAVKVGKAKEQKQVLNDYMYNLHAKFRAEVDYTVSLATFCRRRPRAIAPVNFSSRNVCLCQKHQNFALKLKCLKQLKITSCTSPDKFMETYTEEEVKDLLKGISTTTITYQEWRRKKMKDGKERMRVVDLELPKGEFVNMMIEANQGFAQHIKRVFEQYTSLKGMKDRLPKGHVLVQMDFSENYVCQSLEEILSAYWNATAVTLHPTVIYYKTDSGLLLHKSFVFVSELLHHNATMVLAIVQKILNIARATTELTTIHFWTDSPTSQYRNKTIFDLVSRFHDKFGVHVTWQYFESGHGKGPCDGIGGTTKRNADNAIKQGKVVIQDAEDFFKWATHSDSQIEYQMVTEEDFNESKEAVDQINESVRPLKGTMRVHSVIGMGNGNVRTRETTCACQICFTERGFDEGSSCSWNTCCLRKIDEAVDQNRKEVEEASTEVKKGDFIVIAYEKNCYIGRIEDVDRDDSEVEVLCMENCSKIEGRFRWPRNEDRIWVSFRNILKVIDEPTATGKTRRVFSVCEDIISFMRDYKF